MIKISSENMQTYKNWIKDKEKIIKNDIMDIESMYYGYNMNPADFQVIYKKIISTRKQVEKMYKYIGAISKI